MPRRRYNKAKAWLDMASITRNLTLRRGEGSCRMTLKRNVDQHNSLETRGDHSQHAATLMYFKVMAPERGEVTHCPESGKPRVT